jgi:hypothetical protein
VQLAHLSFLESASHNLHLHAALPHNIIFRHPPCPPTMADVKEGTQPTSVADVEAEASGAKPPPSAEDEVSVHAGDTAAIIPEGQIDPVYEKKAKLLNRAVSPPPSPISPPTPPPPPSLTPHPPYPRSKPSASARTSYNSPW